METLTHICDGMFSVIICMGKIEEIVKTNFIRHTKSGVCESNHMRNTVELIYPSSVE